jgi:hypothetical protein
MSTRNEALAAVGEVEALVGKARDAGLDTLYFEIVPTVARVALEVRWDLPGHEEKREGYVAWVCEQTAELKEQLEALLAGKGRADRKSTRLNSSH